MAMASGRHDRVAVITDIHANLPALRGGARRASRSSASSGVYCGGDLVGYGPHPNEVCALIEERGIPTIYGNYDYAIARDLEDCGCAYITPHDRELGQQSVDWTLAHTDAARRRPSCASCRSTCASTWAASACTWCTARRARSTSTCSRTSRPRSTSASPPAEDADVLVFGHTHKPWVHELRRGAASSTAARSASPRTATRAARSPCCDASRAGRRG